MMKKRRNMVRRTKKQEKGRRGKNNLLASRSF
jgi:hypothetical protein